MSQPSLPSRPPQSGSGSPPSAEVMDAIDRMFAEFELVFHNQYQKAFATREKETWAKRLWYSNLKDFTAQQILDAAHRAIQASDYLPTVHGVLKYIEAPDTPPPALPVLPDTLSRDEKLAALAKLRQETGL